MLHLRLSGLTGLFSFLLLASCSSPLNQLPQARPAVPAHSASLTFVVKGDSDARSVDSEASFLTVELSEVDGSVSHFASATKVGSSYTVTVPSLVAGDYKLRARLYAGGTDPSLLFYANQSLYVRTGKNTTVPLTVYRPGRIPGVSLSMAVLATGIEVADLDTGLWNTAHVSLPLGQNRLVRAVPIDVDGFPATDQRVSWSSSDPSILEVGAGALLKPHRVGTVNLTATTVRDATVARTYEVTVDLPLMGGWELLDNNGHRTTYAQFTRTVDGGLTFTLMEEVQGDQEVSRGVVYALGSSDYSYVIEETLDAENATFNSLLEPGGGVIEITPSGLLSLNSSGERGASVPLLFRPIAGFVESSQLSLFVEPLSTYRVGQVWLPAVSLRNASGQASNPVYLNWFSSDPSVASVGRTSGVVSFLSTGSVTIFGVCLTDPSLSVTKTMTVGAAINVAVIPEATLASGTGNFTFVAADKAYPGRFLASGHSLNGGFGSGVMARFDASGSLDSSFGGNEALPAAGFGTLFYTDSGTPLVHDQTNVLQLNFGPSFFSGFYQSSVGPNSIHLIGPSWAGGWNHTEFYNLSQDGEVDYNYSQDGYPGYPARFYAHFHSIGAPVADSDGNLYTLGERRTPYPYNLFDGYEIRKTEATATLLPQNDPGNQVSFWTVPAGLAAQGWEPKKLAFQANGRLIVAGGEYVVGVTANGAEDPSFGVQGVVRLVGEWNTGVGIKSLAVDSKDNILVTGSTWFWMNLLHTSEADIKHTGYVARLLPDGALDTSFAPAMAVPDNDGSYDIGSNRGIANLPGFFPLGRLDFVPTDLAVQTDQNGDSIVVVGHLYDPNRIVAAKILPDSYGLDLSWGSPYNLDGYVYLDQGHGGYAVSVAVAPDGSIGIAGQINKPGNSDTLPAFWRFAE